MKRSTKLKFINIVSAMIVIVVLPTQFYFSRDEVKASALPGKLAAESVISITDNEKSTEKYLISPSESRVANANYYNESDHSYYADKEFRIPANDNTDLLKGLFQKGGEIFLEEGNYLCKEQLVIGGLATKITGVKGKTSVIFSNPQSSKNKLGVSSCIVNASFQRSYEEEKAQRIDITSVKFLYRRTAEASADTICVFANISSGNIQDCLFISDRPSDNMVTLLDAYSSVRNLNVDRSSFVNQTKAKKGGGIWIRDFLKKDAKPNSVTENVNISECEFIHDAGDEAIAIYSSVGDVRNIKVSRCTIHAISPIAEKSIAVYPAKNEYKGTVSNVTIEECKLLVDYIKTFSITVGAPNYRNTVENVNIIKNTIVVKSSNPDKINRVIYVNDINTSVDNITVNDNYIETMDKTNDIAIYNASKAEGNNIKGKFATAIQYGDVNGNIIENADTGITSPVNAKNNSVMKCVVGISVAGKVESVVLNKIELDKEIGKCGIDRKNGKQLNLVCENNKIVTQRNDQYGIITETKNEIDPKRNQITGPGKNLYIKIN